MPLNSSPGDKLPVKFKWNDPNILTGGVQKNNQPYLVDLITLQKLFFQGLPPDGIRNKIDSAWATISAPGRNVPLYQYTGGEDILSFTITFYADEVGKTDVLNKCKWLQSLTKNDGYDNPPHPCKLVFGDLYKASKYIMYNVEVKYNNFDRSLAMMPCYAAVDIELRKISETNLSLANYRKLDT